MLQSWRPSRARRSGSPNCLNTCSSQHETLVFTKIQAFIHPWNPVRTPHVFPCRWDRHGRAVCFDSTHEGSRQVYVAQPASTPVTARDASALTARGGHVAARHVAVFGTRRAGFVAGLVRQAEDEVGFWASGRKGSDDRPS